jgi:hypothetical protein
MEVPVRGGQGHAGQGLRVGPEVDHFLVVPEDLDDTRILPGDLAPPEPDEVVPTELAEQEVHGNEQGGPLPVGGAGREGGMARLRTGRHHLKPIRREREPGGHGDPQLLEELLVVGACGQLRPAASPWSSRRAAPDPRAWFDGDGWWLPRAYGAAALLVFLLSGCAASTPPLSPADYPFHSAALLPAEYPAAYPAPNVEPQI